MRSISRVTSRLRIGFGSFVAIDAEAADPQVAERGIAAAAAALSAVERLMHPTREGSDLAALIACPAGNRLRVHPWTWEVLDLSRRLHALSGGSFDPCLHSAAGRLRDLELPEAQVVIPHAPLRVDLGGIAKGFAVDRAIDALRAAGCAGGLVNAGGDLAVFGERRHGIVRRERHGAGIVELRDAAMATSEVEETSRPTEHRGYYHGTDRSLRIAGKVTIMAARAVLADGLTKCLLAGERSRRSHLLDAFGAKLLVYEKFSPLRS
jgi:thiamine biosynthesis lipoprotein